MTSYTQNINLLKKDPLLDGAENFNITTMLNDNWDKIDAWANGRSKIQTGTYTGTGLYGASNKNELTFDFVPQIVFIGGKYTAGVTDFYIQSILINDVAQSSALTVGNINNSTYSGAIKITWSGQTVSWQGDTALKQLNYSGGIYNYIAIG